MTAPGLASAALIVSRVAVSVSLVVLVTLTTPWNRLLAALRGLGVPRMFVLIIGMAYRYIFLLLLTLQDMFQARKARAIGVQKHDKSARAFIGASAGTLIGKAHHLSEEVHQAMTARGYRGDAKTLERSRFGPADALCIAAALAVAALIIGGDHFLGR